MTDAKIARLSPDAAKQAAMSVDIPEYMAGFSVFQVLLNHPPLAKALNDMLAALIFKAKLDPRLRELAIMRIGWVTGSCYEWSQHYRVSRDIGMSDEELVAVRDWESYEGFGEAERAVLRATDETLETGTISPETFKACERLVGGPEELLELVVAIGNWRLFSSLLRSLDVPLEDGVEPWPPDGLAPGP